MRERPLRRAGCLAAAVAMALVSTLVFWLADRFDDEGLAISVAIIGTIPALASTALAVACLRDWAASRYGGAVSILVAVGSLTSLAFVLPSVDYHESPLWFVLAATLIATVGCWAVGVFDEVVDIEGQRPLGGSRDVAIRDRIPDILVTAGAVSIVVSTAMLILVETAGSRILLVLWAGASYVAVKVGLPGFLNRIEARWRALLRLGVPMFVTGALLLLVPASWSFVYGLTAVLVAAAILAEAVIRSPRRINRWSSLSLLALAGLSGSVGLGSVLRHLGEWRMLHLLYVGVVLASGFFFVVRGEGVFVFTAVAVVFTWTALDRASAAETWDSDLSGEADHVVVGLGDSYAAGQGAGWFYQRNNDVRILRASPCRRAPTAMIEHLADILAEEMKSDWAAVNLACSGARIENLNTKPQYGDRKDGEWSPNLDRPGGETQYQALGRLLSDPTIGSKTSLITVSIGGNDVGFASLAAACLLPADCTGWTQVIELAEALGRNDQPLDTAFDDLEDVLDEVYEPDDRPPVVVLPYPRLERADSSGCNLALSNDELTFINRLETELNHSLHVQVKDRAGFYIAEGAYEAFGTDLTLCGDPERRGMNFINLTPHTGTVLHRLDPSRWKDGTAHPNERGHLLIADKISGWVADGLRNQAAGRHFDEPGRTDFEFIAEREEHLERSGNGRSSPAVDLPEECSDVDVSTLAAREDVVDCVSAWSMVQLRITASHLGPGTALLFLAGLLVGSALLVAGRPVTSLDRSQHWWYWFFPTAPDENAEESEA